jgi:sugar lactone lactonase YvrE
MPVTISPLLERVAFGEGPRWRGDRLFFSDIGAGEVRSVDLAGRSQLVARVPFRPSGLGWLPDPDGRMLIVSMTDHRLLRLDPDGPVPVADLTPWCGGHANDMVVDGLGRAWIGNLGFDLEAQPMEPRTTSLLRADPDGRVRVAARDMRSPNGMVITPDDATLIVGESAGACLTAFDIGPEGTLSGRRVFAALEGGAVPDGICLDAEGAVWVASPTTHEFLRVLEGGRVADRVPAGEPKGRRTAIACMLGGPERRHLFLITSETLVAGSEAARTSRIDVALVDVPGAGRP